MTPTFSLAPDGVFETVNGEGYFLGVRQVFVRFSGCDVGCRDCDTDYRFAERASLHDVTVRVLEVSSPGVEWVWLTGGEPTLQKGVGDLVGRLKQYGFRVAVATAGERESVLGVGADFVSVSPHRLDRWKAKTADQVNLVPGLGGLELAGLYDHGFGGFEHRWVTPNAGDPRSLTACLDFIKRQPTFRLGIQAHKIWGLA